MDGRPAYDDVELILLETSFVSPAVPTEIRQLYLSSLDLVWRGDEYHRRLLFYETSLPEQRLVVQALKSSLAKALVHFYPLAGRLAEGADGRIYVDCCDKGVEFVEAIVDASFEGLKRTSFQLCPFFNKLARFAEHDLSKIEELPLFSVQVTKFSCGGVAIGVATNHVIADGHSTWHFMNSWAECARGKPISMPPLHTRTAFKVDNPSAKIASKLHLPAPPNKALVTATADWQPDPPLAERLFHASPETIEILKMQAMEESEGVIYDVYELMCAHCWRGVNRARSDVGDGEQVHMKVLGDMRFRVKPEVGRHYFGNGVIFADAMATAKQLRNGEKLAETALTVREATWKINEARMWAKLHWLELNDNDFGERVEWTGRLAMFVGSSPRFSVYSVDFGWGIPLAVRSSKILGDGEMLLFPSPHHHGGGADVCLALTPPSMRALLLDPVFLAAFVPEPWHL